MMLIEDDKLPVTKTGSLIAKDDFDTILECMSKTNC